jgi:hypothetical protein
MPLVFVHGVGSRPGADYDTALEDREDLAKRFMFKRLGYPGKCFDAFWGDVAAKPAWNWACLPGSGIESFGKDDSFVSVLASHAAVINAADRGATLLGIARESSLEDAIDVLWAACDSVSDAEVPGLLEVIDDLLGYAELHSQPPWLREVRDDDEFIERLEQELEGLAARAGGPGEGVEAFGRKREWLANAFTRFGEAVGRTTTVTAKVSGAVLVNLRYSALMAG